MRFTTQLAQFLALTALTSIISGCAYIIPEDPNQPRNNKVIGDTHRPQLNNAVGPQSMNKPRVAPQQMAQVQVNDLPPVDAATQARAQQVMASNAGLPSDRRVPVENAQFQNGQFQVAAAEYPPINSVPERPIMYGPGSTQERLNAVQSDLQHRRDDAAAEKEALARDAAAEPSMLSALPKTDGVVPPSDPVNVAPVVPQTAPLPAAVVPAPQQLRPVVKPSSMAAPLPPVANAAPACIPVAAVAPRPVPQKLEPIVLKAPLEPIVLTPPPAEEAVAPVTVPAPKPVAAVAKPRSDFDPMAVAANAPAARAASAASYASNAYLAPSRYSDHRTN